MSVIDGTLLVRNHHRGPSVYLDEANGTKVPYEWAGAGDPDDEDLLEIPAHIGKNPQFRKSVARGIFEIEEGDEKTIEEINHAGQRWAEKRAAKEEETRLLISQENNRDMVAVDCIGPGPAGGICGQAVVVAAKASNSNTPPLCTAHRHLSNQYVLQEDENAPVVNGRVVRKWVRGSIGRRTNNPDSVY